MILQRPEGALAGEEADELQPITCLKIRESFYLGST